MDHRWTTLDGVPSDASFEDGRVQEVIGRYCVGPSRVLGRRLGLSMPVYRAACDRWTVTDRESGSWDQAPLPHRHEGPEVTMPEKTSDCGLEAGPKGFSHVTDHCERVSILGRSLTRRQRSPFPRGRSVLEFQTNSRDVPAEC
jgi:hypothetical protein